MGKLKSIARLWSETQIHEISEELLRYNETKPVKIHRKIRSLRHIHFWKATEFRTVILYTGIVLFKDCVPGNEYELFLKLFRAIAICSTKKYEPYLPLPRTLLIEFIEGHITTYAMESITSITHNLIHLVDEVEFFGDLNSFSTHPFENCLHMMKLLLKQCNKPLEQLTRRLYEHSLTTPPVSHENSGLELFSKLSDQFICANAQNSVGFRKKVHSRFAAIK